MAGESPLLELTCSDANDVTINAKEVLVAGESPLLVTNDAKDVLVADESPLHDATCSDTNVALASSPAKHS